MGLNIGGHASMVRPLVVPMAEAAAPQQPLPARDSAAVRAHAATSENLGNFFADDILVAVGPVLLMKAFFDSVHVSTRIWEIGAWGAPTAVCALLAGAWRYRALDRRLARPAAVRA